MEFIDYNDLFQQLLKDWKSISLPSLDIPLSYVPVADKLLYADEELVRQVVEILKDNIAAWAYRHSKTYQKHTGLLQKSDLLDKDDWFVKEFPYTTAKMRTSGSTTGVPFQYLRWNDLLPRIEGDNHYDLVLDEHGIGRTPEILYFFKNRQITDTRPIYVSEASTNFMEHHGFCRKARVHYVNFYGLYENNKEEFYLQLINYLLSNPIDVLLMAGPQTNSLCYYLQKNKIKGCLGTLLSNTNERLLPQDAMFLLNNGYVKSVCDHMRCWDGGATFFTCKYYTYHLCDNLSYCTEFEQKLISTDYFSFPSPFVNYWNGDYCKIGNDYKRCECGRLYREFEFLENRPFAVKGIVITEIRDKLRGIPGVKQVKCAVKNIEIVSSETIPLSCQNELQNSFPNLAFKFSVESL